ncbi:MAG: hypothetical protein Q7R35_13925 [Elusimicrobiota bacterium]|nr:hypothetical protein [Elusimicrobiota bacterium]
MPPLIAAMLAKTVEKIKAAAKEMTDSIFIIYTEKGIEPFKRPLITAGAVLLAVYIMIYSPITGKVKRSKMEVLNMKVVSQYAGDYESAKMRLYSYQGKLPRNVKDAKDEWLKRIINDSARNNNVSVDSLGTQRENEVGNYLMVSREVTATTTYGGFGKWLAEMENSPIFLRVTTMNLSRDEINPGSVKVQFTLSTVFPRAVGGK